MKSTARRIDTAQKIRLLFLQHASIFENFGGVEYYLDDLVAMSARLYGSENVWAAIPTRDTPTVLPPYHASFVKKPKAGFLRKLENRVPWRLGKECARLIKIFQPTHLINAHVSLGPLAYYLARAHHLPYLTCAYGIECWGDLWPQDEWALRRADGILSISHWTKQVLVNRGYSAEKIQIVHPRLPSELENVPPVKRPSTGPFTLLTISRLDAREKYKGQDHVIQALALLQKRNQLENIRYLIQGEGSDRARLEGLVKELRLENFVEFRKAVRDRKELHSSYQEADLFVMPSQFGKREGAWRGEGFGIVYVEAAAFGVPSLAYRTGGVMDIVEHESSGWLVEPDNVEALAQAISKLKENRAVVAKAGETARKRVLDNFTGHAIETELSKALEHFER